MGLGQVCWMWASIEHLQAFLPLGRHATSNNGCRGYSKPNHFQLQPVGQLSNATEGYMSEILQSTQQNL